VPASGDFWDKWDKKNSFFEKRTGEVIENTGKGYIDSQKRTEKRSGEVVENTYLWKKRTENEPKTKLPMLLKTLEGQKNEPKTNRNGFKRRMRKRLACSQSRSRLSFAPIIRPPRHGTGEIANLASSRCG
jgi:hypothetical protein